jgi:Ca2+-transporting ATPase
LLLESLALISLWQVEYDDLTTDLTLLCITGIENPLREGVREAVAKCKNAGVRVMMCTGDNPLTAQSIAQQCNIFTDGDIIMEGPKFRILSPDVMKAIAPRLQVLARSSPEDKRILVEMLKERGDIIGVTGDGTDDGPALKTAHIGFSMGVTGTEVAKEASDIILMDDNFSSIVSAIMWGRCVNDAVRKFLQFQINTNITAVLITLVTALPAASKHTALSAVQLLWIYLIMDAFAALALATDPASEALLDRKPDRKTDPLFTVNMIKQIVGQSTYLIIVILIFHFLGLKILGLHFDNSTEQKHQNAVVQTLVFNAFVFAQIWNSFNSRRLDRKLNVFEGVTKNWCFIAITSIGSSLLPETASLLTSSYRGFCPDTYMPCWWSSLPGHPYGWERMGDLTCSWFRCTSTWRSHPSYPQRALRAYLRDATATTQTGGATYDVPRRRAWPWVCLESHARQFRHIFQAPRLPHAWFIICWEPFGGA